MYPYSSTTNPQLTLEGKFCIVCRIRMWDALCAVHVRRKQFEKRGKRFEPPAEVSGWGC